MGVENRLLRRIIRPETDEMMEDWRKMHDEELHNLYCLRNIIRMKKSKRMRFVVYPTFRERMGVYSRLW